MTNLHPDDLPKEVECPKCGEEKTIPANWKVLYDEEGNKIDGTIDFNVPTSKRVARAWYCTCGQRIADELDPHWPGGASGGFVANPE